MPLQERVAWDATPGGQAEKRAFAPAQALARGAHLGDQRLDAGVGQVQAPHRGREVALQRAPAPRLRGRQRPVRSRQLDALLLKPALLRVRRRDPVEGLHDGGKDRLFHRSAPGRGGGGVLAATAWVICLAAVIGLAPAPVGGPDIDDVAKRQRALADRVPPCAHRRHRRQAGAEAIQHRAPPRLDPLRQRRLTLARQERGGRHVAQVHRHRIVRETGDADALPGGRAGRRAFRRRPGDIIGLAVFIVGGAQAGRHGRRVPDAAGAGLVLRGSLGAGEWLGRQRIGIRHAGDVATSGCRRARAGSCEEPHCEHRRQAYARRRPLSGTGQTVDALCALAQRRSRALRRTVRGPVPWPGTAGPWTAARVAYGRRSRRLERRRSSRVGRWGRAPVERWLSGLRLTGTRAPRSAAAAAQRGEGLAPRRMSSPMLSAILAAAAFSASRLRWA